MKLSIVMLTHNALTFTKHAIHSIRQHTEVSYELIVIDNASGDGTQEWLGFENIDKVVFNDTNKGVAGGRNQGIDLSLGEYIVFLDNDTAVMEGWDKELLKTFLQPENEAYQNVGIVGARGDTVYCLNPITFTEPRRRSKARGTFEVDCVPGYCFAIKRELLDVIGRQTEDMGTFWHEDLEYCLRARLAGYKVYANTNIRVSHFEHKSVESHKDISDEDIKLLKPGFEEKAAHIAKRLRSDNVLTIYRALHDDCNEAYCILADRITSYLRDTGMIVIRKPDIRTNVKSFDHCKGFEMSYNGLRYILGHLENDRPPMDWMGKYKMVDYAFCVSKFVKDQLEAWGVPPKKLLDVSPNGVDGKVFNMGIEPIKLFDDDKFTFLSVGAQQPRKGTDLLIKYYCKAFSKKDNVRLVIKNNGYGQERWVKKVIDLFATEDSAEIVQIYDDWPTDYLAGVYRGVAENGAYISTHRGEAFGLPIFEAIACGCLVGATNFGGVATDLKDYVNVALFDYDLRPSMFHNTDREPFYTDEEEPQWAIAKEEEVIAWMKSAAKVPYSDEAAKAVSERLLSEFSNEVRLENFKEALIHSAKEVDFEDFTD